MGEKGKIGKKATGLVIVVVLLLGTFTPVFGSQIIKNDIDNINENKSNNNIKIGVEESFLTDYSEEKETHKSISINHQNNDNDLAVNIQHHEDIKKIDLRDIDQLNSGNGWWNTNWQYKKMIKINHTKVQDDFTNFPVLFYNISSDFIGHAQSDGDDFVFVANDNSTVFNHEIESYNSVSGELVAWVNITSLSSSVDTTLCLYYGNAICSSQENSSGVWDSSFAGVWHLDETCAGTGGTHYDSTSNNNDGTTSGGVTTSASGQIDGADNFDGSDDTVNCGNGASLAFGGSDSFTFSALAKIESAPGSSSAIIAKDRTGAPARYQTLFIDQNAPAGRVAFLLYDGANIPLVETSTSYADSQWHYWAGVRDTGTGKMYLYLDGDEYGNTTDTTGDSSSSEPFRIAYRGLYAYMDGSVDEVRVSNVARNASWIKTCYNNQNEPGSFMSVNEEVFLWWNTSWTYRKQIIIDHTGVQDDFTNFPVLFDNISSDFIGHAQSDGDDFVFIGGDSKKYHHEIEYYDSVSGELVAWINITELSSSVDTAFWLYYGNPDCNSQQNSTGVWDSTFAGVWHLDETCAGTDGTHYDSTSNNNDGTTSGDVTTTETGQIDGADNFDGSDDTVNCGNDGSLAFGSGDSFTFSAWAKIDTGPSGGSSAIIAKDNMASPYKYQTMMVDHNSPSGRVAFVLYDGTNIPYIMTTSSYADSLWHYWAGVRDTSTGKMYLYLDGNEYANITDTTGDTSSTAPFRIAYRGLYNYLDGSVDEVRVSNVARDADWIKTCYNNQKNIDNFLSVGMEYPPTTSALIITDEYPINGSIGVDLTPVLSVWVNESQGDSMDLYYRTNASTGEWHIIGENLSIFNSTVYCDNTSEMNQFNTKYWWSVNVTNDVSWENVTFSFTTKIAPGVWWDGDWPYRKKIVVSHDLVSADLLNFPLVIDIVDSDILVHGQSNGDDIIFTDYSGNQLYHEIETYNNTNGHLICWVNVTFLLSSEDTVLYMYYGNPVCDNQEDPESVWDSDYSMVHHLDYIPPEQATYFTKDWSVGTSNYAYSFVTYDINGDGVRDLIHSLIGTGVTARYGNNGSLIWSAGYGTEGVSLGDLDDNGFPSLICSGSDGIVRHLNITTGALIASSPDLGTKVGQSLPIIDMGHGAGREMIAACRSGQLAFLDKDLNILNSTDNWDNCGLQPSVMDVDGDDFLDIFIGKYSDDSGDPPGRFYRLNASDFSIIWDITIFSNAATADPVLIDLDHDGIVEIVRSVNDYGGGASPNLLYAFEIDGSEIWNYTVEEEDSPQVGDLDHDGDYEIVGVSLDGELYIVNESGVEEWRQDVTDYYPAYRAPLVCDVDGDADLEIVVWVKDGLKVFDVDGNLLYTYSDFIDPGTLFAIDIEYCDIDNDGFGEILVGSDREVAVVQTKGFAASEDHITIRRDYRRNRVHDWLYDDTYFVHNVEKLNTSNLADSIVLTNQSGSFYNGSLKTGALRLPDSRFRWETINYDVETPSGTSVSVDVFNASDDSLLASDVSSSSDLNIGDGEIYLLFNLNTNLAQDATPQLHYYSLRFVNITDTFTPYPVSEPSDEIVDSTNYNNDGTPVGDPADCVGVLDGGVDFGISHNVFDCGNDGSLDMSSFSIEMWGKLPDVSSGGPAGNGWMCSIEKGEASGRYGIWTQYGKPVVSISGSMTYADASDTMTDDTWSYIVGTFNGTTTRIFVDGVESASKTGDSLSPGDTAGDNLMIGDTSVSTFTGWWEGSLDEVRISSVARNASWIETCFNNQVNPGAFYNIETEEYSGGIPTIGNPIPANNAVNIPITLTQLSVEINDSEGERFNWSIETSPNIGSSSGTLGYNGTKLCVVSGLSNGVSYTWFVNATDEGSGLTSSKVYVFTTELGPGPWWNYQWLYRKQISINHTKVSGNSDLLNFPVLLSLELDNDLAIKAQSTGDDIIFTDYYGNQLYHEIEYYNSSNGELIAWINVTVLSDSLDTILYIYYGNPYCTNQENPSGVWDDDFKMVHHLNEEMADSQFTEEWHKYENNPLLTPTGTNTDAAFPTIIIVNGTYHMYYDERDTAGHYRIYHATSLDGLNWTKDDANNPVKDLGNDYWNDSILFVGDVWIENNTWYMVYTGRGGGIDVFDNTGEAIGLATSSDGINWTDSIYNPILEGSESWEGDSLEVWGVIKVNDTYYLEYESQDQPWMDRQIGIAWSIDLVNWTKDPENPIWSGYRHNGCWFKRGDYYYHLVSHNEDLSNSEIELYRDTEPTFHNDSRELIRIVIRPGSNSWDDHVLDAPHVITDDIYSDTFPNDELWCTYSSSGGGGVPGGWLMGYTIETDIDAAILPYNQSANENNWINDSTYYKNNGSFIGYPINISGIIDGAADLVLNYNNGFNCGDDSSLDVSDFTLEMWAKLPDVNNDGPAGNGWMCIIEKGNTSDNRYGLWTTYGRPTITVKSSILMADISDKMVDDIWSYIVAILEGDTLRIYIDGEESNSMTGVSLSPGDTTGDDLLIGQSSVSGNVAWWEGCLDEIRLSDRARSSGWIITSYNNQYNPTEFYTISSEEFGETPDEPIQSNEYPINGATNIEFNPTLSISIIDYQNDSMDLYFRTNVTTSIWHTIGDYTNIYNGTYTCINTADMNQYNTKYWWSVNVTDSGSGNWTNRSYWFISKQNNPPVITNEIPSDGSTSVSISFSQLMFNISDPEGDLMNYTVETSPYIGDKNENNIGNGTISINITGLTYSTTYTWFINATDSVSGRSTNKIFKFSTETEPAGWWNPVWQYRKEIIIDHTKIPSTLINFPFLLNITDSDIANNSKCQTDGDDIIFTDYGGNVLNHEIELFNQTTGNLVCWVNITTLSSSVDTILYLYYGNQLCENQQNPPNVWDDNYKMVHHLNEQLNGTFGYIPTWTDYPGNPILTPGSGESSTAFASVLIVNDTYHMYYSRRQSGTNYYRIDHATSDDGINWTKDAANNPVLDVVPGSYWESGEVYCPIVWIENNTWYMIYTCRGGDGSPGHPEAVSLAISSDGINWTRHNGVDTPILTGGEIWEGNQVENFGIIKVNDTYYMEYESEWNPWNNRSIGIATSTDLVNWTKDSRNPIWTDNRYCGSWFKRNEYFYHLVPHGTIIELYRDTNPTFYPEDRELVKIPITASATDTPWVLTDDIYKDTFPNDELWCYYSTPGWIMNLAIETEIDAAVAMAGETGEPIYDSTIYGNDGDVMGTPASISGVIDGAAYLIENVTEDAFNCGNDNSLDLQEFTLQVWAKLPDANGEGPAGNGWECLISKGNLATSRYSLWTQYGRPCVAVNDEYFYSGGLDIMQDDTWMQITAIYDGTSTILYINGVQSSSTTDISLLPDDTFGDDLIIGQSSVSGHIAWWEGCIDEVRISNKARSPTWISTEYENQLDPGSFYSLGIEEIIEEIDEPIIWNEQPNNNSYNNYLMPDLSVNIFDWQNDSMDLVFRTNASNGEWHTIGENLNVYSGIYICENTGEMNDYNTKYWWSVNVTDSGSGNWTNQTFIFYTKPNEALTITDETPLDGTIGVPISTSQLSFYISDPEGDLINYTVETYPNIGDKNDSNIGNKTVTINISGLIYSTVYYWYINATDMGSKNWINTTYTFTTESEPGVWWDDNWLYRKPIQINHNQIETDLNDFPVLISLSDSDIETKAQDDGDDIIFTDYFANKLHHEIEDYDSGNLIAWVNVSDLSSTEHTTIYLYYGNPICDNQENPTGVWDSRYTMVQHLDETCSGSGGIHIDSTNNGNNMTTENGTITYTSGIINGADRFDGVDDLVYRDEIPLQTQTISFWFNSDVDLDTNLANSVDPFVNGGTVIKSGISVQYSVYGGIGQMRVYTAYGSDWGTHSSNPISFNAGTWYYCVVSYNQTTDNVKLYIDKETLIDENSATNGNGITYSGGRLQLANAFSYWWNGFLDEVRISNIDRSRSWINTSYINQLNPSAFYNIGFEEFKPPVEPMIINENPEDDSMEISLIPTLSIEVIDWQNDSIDVYFRTNATTGIWHTIGEIISIYNGTYICENTSEMNDFNTKYWWSVNATDSGSGNWTNKTFTFYTEHPPALWWDANWAYRKKISLKSTMISVDLNNFPLLIKLTDNDLKNYAQNDGDDIVFIDYSGIKLSHEIEEYNSGNGSLIAWVNILNYSSKNDAIIYMYYGNPASSNQENPSGVWLDDYKMVHHMEETSGMRYDSTNYNNHGSLVGNPIYDSNGVINGAIDFDDTYENALNCGMSNSLDFASFTIETWAKLPDADSNGPANNGWMCLIEKGNTGFTRYGIWTKYGRPALTVNNNFIYADSSDTLIDDTWAYIVATHDGSISRLYINGEESNNIYGWSLSPSDTRSDDLLIGQSSVSGNVAWWEGHIDEVRVSDIARNVSWISTTYLNQLNPNDYYFTSIQENGSSYEPPIPSNEIPTDDSEGVILNPTLSIYTADFQGDIMTVIFMTNSSGSWEQIGSNQTGGNGTYNQPTTNFSEFKTRYYWRICVFDGNHWTNETYSFETRPWNYPPTFTNLQPYNEEIIEEFNPDLFVTVTDSDGDSFNLSISINVSGIWEEIAHFSNVSNNTYSAGNLTKINEINTWYNWRVSAYDGKEWANETFNFYINDLMQIIGWYFCGGGSYLCGSPDGDTFYNVQFAREGAYPHTGDCSIQWEAFNRNKGWVVVNDIHNDTGNWMWDPSTDGDSQGGPSLGYFGDEFHHFWSYHINQGPYFEYMHKPKWSDFPNSSYSEKIIFSNTGGGQLHSSMYAFNNSFAMVFYNKRYPDIGQAVTYSIWNESDGWSDEIRIDSTGYGENYVGAVYSPTLIPLNSTTWYIYYKNLSVYGSNTYIMRVYSLDGGDTWSMPERLWQVPASGTIGITRYGDNYYMTDNVQLYKSNDGINWQYIDNVADIAMEYYAAHSGAHSIMLDQSHILWAGSEYGWIIPDPIRLGQTWGGVYEIPEMISYPGESTNPYPEDNTTFSEGTTSVYLNVIVHGNQTYDVAFYWDNGTFIGQDRLLQDGDIASVKVSGLSSGKIYDWYAITHGAVWSYFGHEPHSTTDENKSQIWSFAIGNSPIIFDESPADNSVMVPITISELSFNISDPQGDPMNYTIETSPNIGFSAGNNVIDGRYNTSITGLAYDTTYTWFVNVTDNQEHWTNVSFTFTTLIDKPIVTSPNPADGAENILLNPDLLIDVFDYQNDSIDIYFRTNATGSWETIKTYIDVYDGSYICNNTTSMNNYNTTYYWSVNATDSGSGKWTNQTYHFTTRMEPGGWWNTNWIYRKEILINHSKIMENLLNFPVLIMFSDMDLVAHAQTDTDDILFTDYYGNKQNHEIEYYNDNTGKMIAWVNVTSLSSTNDTVLYMYYGNPSCGNQENSYGVWDGNYRFVHHMNDETTSTIVDSTSNNKNGDKRASNSPQEGDGYVGKCQDFISANNDYITVSDNFQISTSDWTLETWVNIVSDTGVQPIIQQDDGSGAGRTIIETDADQIRTYLAGPSQGVAVYTYTPGEWLYITLIHNNTGNKVDWYFDGIYDESLTCTPEAANGQWLYATYKALAGKYDGMLDEIRFSTIQRSDNWINTSYVNQHDPDSFLSIGFEEFIYPETPIISNENPVDGAIDIGLSPVLSVQIVDPQGDNMDVYFHTNASTGNWHIIGENLTISNSTVYCDNTSEMSHYSTMYWWSVNATDSGSGNWTNNTFTFSTEMKTVLDPFNSGWQYRKPISINYSQVENDLINFPVLLSISTDPDLVEHAQADGDDILFMDDTGLAAKLHHEIEYYNDGTGELICWVNVTHVSSTKNTEIYMYYGNPSCTSQENPTEVWDSNYVMVQHMKDATIATIADSTSYGNDGVKGAVNEPLETTAKIDTGQDFDGTNDYINCGTDSSLAPIKVTVEGWVKLDSYDASMDALVQAGSTSDNYCYELVDYSNELRFYMRDSGGPYYANTSLPSLNEWHYWTGTYNGSTISIYLDGQKGSDEIHAGINTDISHLYIGRGFSNYIDSIIDEVRISNVARNASWITTSYNTMKYTDSFISLGVEELGTDAPYITNVYPANGSYNIDLQPTCHIDANDRNGDLLIVYWYENTTGSWNLRQTNSSIIANTTVEWIYNQANAYETPFWWRVHVNDGMNWTNHTYHFTTKAEPGVWWNKDWSYRKLITLNHSQVAGDLINFPVLINFVDSNLMDHSQSDGDDLVFTDYYGKKLYHEIEYYNYSNSELICWVNVTDLSSSQDTFLYMYYGNPSSANQENPSGVWDANYMGIWHLSETCDGSGGTHYDSTQNNNNGTTSGGITTDITGIIDGADQLDGSDDNVFVSHNASLDITDQLTASLWIRPESLPFVDDYRGMISRGSETNRQYWIWGIKDKSDIGARIGDTFAAPGGAGVTMQENNWYHISLTGDPSSNIVLYFNGEEVSNVSYGIQPTSETTNLYMGFMDTFDYFPGAIDEVRISNIARNSKWINTTFNTINDPNAFHKIGDEETAPSDIIKWNVTLSLFGPGNLNDTVVFGEGFNASDGQDVFDVPKPAAPPAPYVYAWFDANLSEPYDKLWVDYRDYPDDFEVWDLYVLWEDSESANLTLSWDSASLLDCEYNVVLLRDIVADVEVDMFDFSNYTYSASSFMVRHFEIVCSLVPEVFNYSVSLLEEWNLVSLPVNESVFKGDVVVEYLGVNYSWDDAVSSGILIGFVYGWNDSVQNYMIVDVFEPGCGYWMYAYNNCILWVSSNVSFNDDFISVLSEEWNLVGLPFDESVAVDNLTVWYNGTLYSWDDAVSSGILIGFFYGWNTSVQNYMIVDVLEPGRGYWMYTYYNCILKR